MNLSHKACTVHWAVCNVDIMAWAYHVKWSVMTIMCTSLPPSVATAKDEYPGCFPVVSFQAFVEINDAYHNLQYGVLHLLSSLANRTDLPLNPACILGLNARCHHKSLQRFLLKIPRIHQLYSILMILCWFHPSVHHSFSKTKWLYWKRYCSKVWRSFELTLYPVNLLSLMGNFIPW